MNFLTSFADFVDKLNDKVGRVVAWAALIMVLAQFIVVMLRYVFSINEIMMQESVVYMHAFLFLVGSGYTLLRGGHVRVDIFYRDASPKKKAWVDLFGVFVFLVPVCVLIWIYSWPYIANSWRVLEGSTETSGIQAVFLLKTTILLFAGLMTLQALSMAARSWLVIKGLATSTPEQTEDLQGA